MEISNVKEEAVVGRKELIDLVFSCVTTLAHASSSEIKSVKQSKEYKLPKDLLYKIELQRSIENENDTQAYEPEVGDLIAITSVRPKCVDDQPERPYLVAYVKSVKEREDHFKIFILLSKPTLDIEHTEESERSKTLFAVKLINMTTNQRIWNALNRDQKVANMNIIQNVLQAEFFVRWFSWLAYISILYTHVH
ncbi:hypothetical protein TorRG33x02_165270 [Trema orientale]|uniref:DUF6469 domain-containing protein n=1 Tax=Trema orientale TaxID=63057 RepID=A0A2P5EQ48_TREOI|nr:hypothetical protein TorRG33x02_165270 [Trema orientale]